MAVQQQAKKMSEDWLSQITNYLTPSKGDNDWSYYDKQVKDNSQKYYQQSKADANFQYERDYKNNAYELQQQRSYNAMNERNAVANKRQDAILQNSLQQQNVARQNQSSGSKGGGGISGGSFGKWSGPTLMYSNGMPRSAENSQRIQDFNFQRNAAAESARMITTAEAAGDIARTKAQGEVQRSLVSAQSKADINKLNRQNAADMKRLELQSRLNSKESSADRAQRDRLAQLDAATRLQQSMWNSYSNNAGSGGFQYWGGSI